MSRLNFNEIETRVSARLILCPNIFPGFPGSTRLSFPEIVAGYSENVTGEKQCLNLAETWFQICKYSNFADLFFYSMCLRNHCQIRREILVLLPWSCKTPFSLWVWACLLSLNRKFFSFHILLNITVDISIYHSNWTVTFCNEMLLDDCPPTSTFSTIFYRCKLTILLLVYF